MAEMVEIKDYRKSNYYKTSDKKKQQYVEAYRKEFNVAHQHMNLLLTLQDLRDMPKEKRQKGNFAAEITCVVSIFLFLAAYYSASKTSKLCASLFVIFSTVVYLSGITNPYTGYVRKVKKQLKNFPDYGRVDDYVNAKLGITKESNKENI